MSDDSQSPLADWTDAELTRRLQYAMAPGVHTYSECGLGCGRGWSRGGGPCVTCVEREMCQRGLPAQQAAPADR